MHRFLRVPLLLAAAALAACAAPVFKDAPPAVATPLEVAGASERYHDAGIVWGGKILGVRNRADTTEVEIVAYPLDRAQRPDPGAQTLGRFVISLPGFVEPLDYPSGRFVTLQGRIAGSEVARIDEHDVVLPIVGDANVHLWPVNFPYDGSHWSFGVGVGVAH
jgi:outer membrane lipoprotein